MLPAPPDPACPGCGAALVRVGIRREQGLLEELRDSLRLAWRRLRLRPLELPACRGCGYPARGLTGWICPECGADARRLGHLVSRPLRFDALGCAVGIGLVWVVVLAATLAITEALLRKHGPRHYTRHTQAQGVLVVPGARVALFEMTGLADAWLSPSSKTPQTTTYRLTLHNVTPGGARPTSVRLSVEVPGGMARIIEGPPALVGKSGSLDAAFLGEIWSALGLDPWRGRVAEGGPDVKYIARDHSAPEILGAYIRHIMVFDQAEAGEPVPSSESGNTRLPGGFIGPRWSNASIAEFGARLDVKTVPPRLLVQAVRLAVVLCWIALPAAAIYIALRGRARSRLHPGPMPPAPHSEAPPAPDPGEPHGA
jgi:hypothetical protein